LEMNNIMVVPWIIQGTVKSGYLDEDIKKILGK
jgi:hypothetical protein